eukprot:TRINITY_DN3164_c0_g2_i1.p1 TRINITY_DN3164_c0_g2~~TRINITY_DN3164_c0_g2_i1.p1  ORF type:complete len:588 (-),score=74.95 TRINITY_DN3164_c0_g2_i1:18-1781(-)
MLGSYLNAVYKHSRDFSVKPYSTLEYSKNRNYRNKKLPNFQRSELKDWLNSLGDEKAKVGSLNSKMKKQPKVLSGIRMEVSQLLSNVKNLSDPVTPLVELASKGLRNSSLPVNTINTLVSLAVKFAITKPVENRSLSKILDVLGRSIVEEPLPTDNIFFNSIIMSFAQMENYQEVQNWMAIHYSHLQNNRLPLLKVVTYNSVLRLLLKEKNILSLFELYDQMIAQQILPTTETYNILLLALLEEKNDDRLKSVMNEFKLLGIPKNENSKYLEIIHSELKDVKDLTYLHKKASNLSLKGLITKYLEWNKIDLAFDLMQNPNFDETHYFHLIQECSRLKLVEVGVNGWSQLNLNWLRPNTKTMNARIRLNTLMPRHVAQNDITNFILEVENNKILPNQTLFQNLIHAAGLCGNVKAILRIFEIQKKHGITPNINIWKSIIKAYSRNKLSSPINAIFNVMEQHYNLKPTSRMLIDALSSFTSASFKQAWQQGWVRPIYHAAMKSNPKIAIKVLVSVWLDRSEGNQLKSKKIFLDVERVMGAHKDTSDVNLMGVSQTLLNHFKEAQYESDSDVSSLKDLFEFVQQHNADHK